MSETSKQSLSVVQLRGLHQVVNGLCGYVQEVPDLQEREEQHRVLQEVTAKITVCLQNEDTDHLSITAQEMSVLLDVMLEVVGLVSRSRRRVRRGS